MKVSCLQENLYRGLQIVRSSIGKESSLPILSTILLKTDDGALSLNATNLEIGVHYVVRGKIDEQGSIAIDAKTFTDYIGLLPKEKIDIETFEDGRVSIKCHNFSTKIRGMSPEDFPIIPTLEKKDSISCSVVDLKSAIASTIFTVSQNEARPELSGLLFHINVTDGVLFLAGTDAYRLGEKKIKVQTTLTQDCDVILPVKTLQELLRIMQYGVGGTIDMYITESHVLFISEGVELFSKRIQGTYPDYTQIIPKQFSTSIRVDRAELIQAIKASSIFSKSGVFDVQIKCTPTQEGRGTLSAFSSNATVGENTAVLDVEYEGSANEVLLNYKYFLDGLQTINEETLFFGIVDSTSPCVIRPLENKEYLYLVMPIRQ